MEISPSVPVSLARTLDEVTDAWLAAALGVPELQIASITPIGTGQMSQSHRVCLAPGGPEASVVVKLASADPGSRSTGVGMGAYWREVSFYQRLASRLGWPVPACHHAAYDEHEGWFTLVLEDVADGRQGNQIAGCSVEEARSAVRALARIQGPVLGDLHAGTVDYLNQRDPLDQALATAVLPAFLERYAGRIAAEHVDVCERFVAVLDAWAADRRPPLGLVHGDFRLDNLLFTPQRCRVVDWQTVSWGPALYDLSYFIGGAFDPAVRRAHEEELVRLYHDELLAQGVHALGWEACWQEYRRQVFGGLRMVIVASMVVEQTQRGDDMFMAWLARNAQQVLDLDALALLPEPGTRPPALRPAADDEARHPRGPEDAWNESWYFDAVSDDGSLAMYTRLGRVPNREHAVFMASIVRAGRPAVLLVDHAAPLPAAEDDTQAIRTGHLQVEQHCEVPLERFRVVLSGTAEVFDDPSAPLRGERGTPVEIAFDLVWTTDGAGYQWRQSTRYEIPCRVSGTVRVGDETLRLEGPGQRDHSWGARDWFASDWMWSAIHLDDDTHLHAVGVPQMPGLGVGYVQSDGDVTEVQNLHMSERFTADGLVAEAQLTIEPGDLVVTVTPIGWGAVRFDGPEGRVAEFPRAACRVTTADGRTGLGWIEWNRNRTDHRDP